MQIQDSEIASHIVEASGLEARVWIPARCFFSRSDTQTRCWLWLLQRDGQVRAMVLPSRCMERDELLPGLVRACRAEHKAETPADARQNQIRVLPNAPIVPLPRWAVSWGHPVQRAIRAFAARLDAATLEALGDLEAPGPFVGSTQNYNRLASLPAPIRRRRLQALADFPAWLAPLLLEPCVHPDMFGDEYEDDRPWRHRPSPIESGLLRDVTGCRNRRGAVDEILDAIDRGRDLIGAIAGFHGVDRALIRSPLGRTPWRLGGMPSALLPVLAAIPAHARPAQRAEVEDRLEYLQALPARLQSRADVQRMAQAFKTGWNRLWQELERDFPPLPQTLRDSRDFLAAALGEAPLRGRLADMETHHLALAWIARRGLRSLLQASRRWHAQPVRQAPIEPRELPDEMPVLFGEWRTAHGTARELASRQALVDEGARMQHCVADYWHRCVLDGTRIVHLERPDGETATAQLDLSESLPARPLWLEQLRGPRNAEPSAAMEEFAEALTEWLCADTHEAARLRLAEAARLARQRHRPGNHHVSQRALDARSRSELAQVLAFAATQADWQVPEDALLCSHVAGFHYAHGPYLLERIDLGDALTLAREPDNPHDAAAVRIEWNGAKLGYVPRAENTPIARRLDRGERLSARVIELDRNDAWAPLRFVIEPMPQPAPAT